LQKLIQTISVVAGELNCAVYLHELNVTSGVLPCWSYVTEGLVRYGQREVIFTLVRETEERPDSYPRDPVDFFRSLHGLSKQGRYVGPGGYTWISGPDLVGFHGVTYLEPEWRPPDISSPGDWLAALGLTADELAAIREFGSARVQSILGKVERFYPAPYWTRRNRPSCFSTDSMKLSLLSGTPLVGDSGFSVFRQQGRIVLRARSDGAENTRMALASIPPDKPLGFLTQLDSAADGALVWLPGQTQAEAITPPGSKGQRICGSFVFFLPGREADGGQLLEDGYVLHLTSQSWGALRNAILNRVDLETGVFNLHWTPAGSKEYLPRHDVAETPSSGQVRLQRIVLLQSNEESSAAITADSLAAFARCVEDEVRKVFSGGATEGRLRVTVKIGLKREGEYELANQGEFEQPSLQLLWDELQKLTPPPVNKSVGFAVEFAIGNRK
jgi:hypothetical protein